MLLSAVPRVLLIACLLGMPWMYGVTPPWARVWFADGLGTVGVVWLLTLLGRWKRPAGPPLVQVGVGLMLAAGWCSVLNASAEYRPGSGLFLPLRNWVDWLPASMDRSASLQTMRELTGVAAAFLVALDSAAERRWRVTWVAVVGLTAAALGGFGLVQKVSGAEAIYWDAGVHDPNFFSVFYNRNNAAAMINLGIPTLGALVVMAALRRLPSGIGVVAGLLGMVAAAAGLANASRAGAIVCAGLVAASVALGLWMAGRHLTWPTLCLHAAVAVAAVAGLGWASGWHRAFERWQENPVSADGRWALNRVTWTGVVTAGPFGSGPGTYFAMYPAWLRLTAERQSGGDEAAADEAETALRARVNGVPRLAHNDWLQVWAEWGWLGGSGVVALVVGGMRRGAGSLRQAWRRGHAGEAALLGGALVALAGLLAHAAVDFPLHMPVIQLHAAVLLALLWASPQPGPPPVRRRRRSGQPAREESALPVDPAPCLH